MEVPTIKMFLFLLCLPVKLFSASTAQEVILNMETIRFYDHEDDQSKFTASFIVIGSDSGNYWSIAFDAIAQNRRRIQSRLQDQLLPLSDFHDILAEEMCEVCKIDATMVRHEDSPNGTRHIMEWFELRDMRCRLIRGLDNLIHILNAFGPNCGFNTDKHLLLQIQRRLGRYGIALYDFDE